MSPIFGTKYDDGELALLVEQALIDDPLADAAALMPSVRDGVIILSGPVANNVARERIINRVQETLDAAGVDYKRLEDELTVRV